MAITLIIKQPLEQKVEKAFKVLLAKKLHTNKQDFLNNCISSAIDDLYKSKVI
tara:strand:- start:161 stop:319 length:159 start_codon:yes stop_codon:yes gene_type:complete